MFVIDGFTVEDTALSGGEIFYWMNRRRCTATGIRQNREMNGYHYAGSPLIPGNSSLSFRLWIAPSLDRIVSPRFTLRAKHSKAYKKDLRPRRYPTKGARAVDGDGKDETSCAGWY